MASFRSHVAPLHVLPLVAAFFVSAVPQNGAGTAAPAAPLPTLTAEVTRTELEHHVRYLASDELRGRFTGTPEAVRAAQYLAAVLQASGVQPAGDDGTFLQRVPFERTRAKAVPELRVTTKSGAPLPAVFGADFDLPLGLDLTTTALRVVHVKRPADLPAEPDPKAALFVEGSVSERRRLLTRKNEPGANGWGLRVGEGRAKRGTPKPAGGDWSPPMAPRGPGDVWLTLNGELLEAMKAGEVVALELVTHVEREALPAYNVVGVLPGAGDGALGKETVVLSAHYDHLHARDEAGDADAGEPGAEGGPKDVVFNGADDDASGCAAVLELAGRLGASKRPQRTVVFLLATGEEIGLVGTWYYLDHPARPLETTVANLNFEMIGRPDEKVGGPGKLWLTGFELSNLGAAFAEAKLDIAIDPRPEQHFFERSDNIAFVRRGIVGQTFSTYNLHEDYHRVSDEADTLDYAHLEACTRSAVAAVELVVDGKVKPAWLPGKDPNAPRGERKPSAPK
ncbi:MAG: M28 family peptidase [Planctomycetes bacterium]|nr:M28 family peptidase [Planctomycetota bacterium]